MFRTDIAVAEFPRGGERILQGLLDSGRNRNFCLSGFITIAVTLRCVSFYVALNIVRPQFELLKYFLHHVAVRQSLQ